ncbi:MAG: arginine--tRNA ligase [Phycisphaerae bacterium]|nr:arginine--tRNA ligase [Phycisphaerae bacterium]
MQKTDEWYLYATTDLAAIRYRVNQLKADRVLYVTDSRQALHFRQVFAVARAAKFAPESVSLEPVAFGMMLGADGKPFRTREGGTVKLMDLLDEAERRAFELVSAKNPDLDEPHRREIARVVGIGAVKYADLAQNRTSDYVFSWDKMLTLDGNTAPYMQYAYARIRSIFRKGFSAGNETPKGGALQVAHPAERALALRLVRFAETVAAVADQCLPHILCAYLYDLAGAFMGFYETCPVLQADGATRASRLTLCDLTARTIRTGLDLLGIQTLEQM